jgi:hypothetical protein
MSTIRPGVTGRIGGVMWAQYQAVVSCRIGDRMTILVFVILIIGGLGSVVGWFIGAILVGLTSNCVEFLVPKLALGSIAPLLVSPRDAWRMLGCGNTRGYELLDTGELVSFLDGRSRKITVESIHQYIARKVAAAGSPPSVRGRMRKQPAPDVEATACGPNDGKKDLHDDKK